MGSTLRSKARSVVLVACLGSLTAGCGRHDLVGEWTSLGDAASVEFRSDGAARVVFHETSPSSATASTVEKVYEIDLGFVVVEYSGDHGSTAMVRNSHSSTTSSAPVRIRPRDPKAVPWTKVLLRASAGAVTFPFAPSGRRVAYKVADGDSLAVEANIGGTFRDLKGIWFKVESLDSELKWRTKVTVDGSYVRSSGGQVELVLPLEPRDSTEIVLARGSVDGNRMHLRGESFGLPALDYARQPKAEQGKALEGEALADSSNLHGVKIPKSNVYVNTGTEAPDPQAVVFHLPGAELVGGVAASRPPSSGIPALRISGGTEELRSTRAFRCWVPEPGQTVVGRVKGLGLITFQMDKLCFDE